MNATATNNVHNISQRRASQYLCGETSGLIFTAFFMKADGSIREMRCRTGVRKHLRGGQKPYNDSEHNILTVFDMQKGQYRSMRLDRLISFNIHGETFVVI